MREGWFCPGCQAFHSPTVDTCEVAGRKERFHCNICHQSREHHVRCERKDCLTHVLVGGVSSKELH